MFTAIFLHQTVSLTDIQTIVSIGSTFVHYSAAIYSEPDKFIPERWLRSTDLDNWLVAFSRGPRMCLGVNLAWAELRLGFAHVYRKFDLVPTRPLYVHLDCSLCNDFALKAN